MSEVSYVDKFKKLHIALHEAHKNPVDEEFNNAAEAIINEIVALLHLVFTDEEDEIANNILGDVAFLKRIRAGKDVNILMDQQAISDRLDELEYENYLSKRYDNHIHRSGIAIQRIAEVNDLMRAAKKDHPQQYIRAAMLFHRIQDEILYPQHANADARIPLNMDYIIDVLRRDLAMHQMNMPYTFDDLLDQDFTPDERDEYHTNVFSFQDQMYALMEYLQSFDLKNNPLLAAHIKSHDDLKTRRNDHGSS